MAKTQTTTTTELEQQAAAEQPENAATVPEASASVKILTAPTIEALFEQVEQLKATLQEGQTLTAGAVGRSYDDGQYTIQVNIL